MRIGLRTAVGWLLIVTSRIKHEGVYVVDGLDGSASFLEETDNFIEELSIPESLVLSLDIGWSIRLVLLDFFSEFKPAVLVFSWLPVLPGLMFVEDGDWQTPEEFGVIDCAPVELGPGSVPIWMIQIVHI